MGGKVVGRLAVSLPTVTLLRVVAEIGLQGEAREAEQRPVDDARLQGMLGLLALPALDAASMADDVVAQLQVVVVSCCLIAAQCTRAFGVSFNCFVHQRRS